MNVVICAIAKNEHFYINDWLKHHFSIGFNHVYLFDNDDPQTLFIGDVILPEYKNKVTIFNVRGIRKQWFQQECYNTFYQQYNHQFDWCAFIDIDEYIIVEETQNIESFVAQSKFDNYISIKLLWHTYGDDDCVERDISLSPLYFFKKEINPQLLKYAGKQMTRGGLDKRVDIHNHNCFYNGQIQGQCTASGEPCMGENHAISVFGHICNHAYINHYMTKTLSEFLNQKFMRGDAMYQGRVIDDSYFWKLNRKTPEKLRYLKEFLEKNGNINK